jgi:hypothetical protein
MHGGHSSRGVQIAYRVNPHVFVKLVELKNHFGRAMLRFQALLS